MAHIRIVAAEQHFVSYKIRVTCSTCGDQEVSSNRVQARFCVETNEAEYEFPCPDCADAIVKSCDDDVLDALEAVGVAIDFWSVATKGPVDDIVVITLDEINEFCEVLEDDSLFEKALEELAA